MSDGKLKVARNFRRTTEPFAADRLPTEASERRLIEMRQRSGSARAR